MNRETAFAKAFEVKSNAAARREAAFEAALATLGDENPRYAKITAALAAAGAKTAITALSGDKDELIRLQQEITALSNEREQIIKQAGIFKAPCECELCNDSGYVKGKICDCIKKLAKNFTIQALGSEFPLDECRFDNFNLDYYPDIETGGINPRRRMEQIFNLCKDYAENFSPKTSKSLLFMGESGLGKTHLTLSVVYELLQKDFDCIYGSAYNLFSAMENEHFSNRVGDSYAAAIGCDLLVIDDLGSEFVSPFIQTLVYNIINTRLLAKKPVIISTNLSMAEIESRYTPRVSSRLLGSYTAKKFCGRDIRQLKALEGK